MEHAVLLDVARSAVALGCKLLSTSEPGAVQAKGDRDFVTELDILIQATVRTHLADETPEIGFLGEEAQPGGLEDRVPDLCWVLDPIDGTSNFIHGLPFCAVSLALVRDGTPVIGVVGAPFLALEYYAAEGGGAFVNGRPIRHRGTGALSRAIVSIGDYGVGAEAAAKNRVRLAVTAGLADQVERVRMFGSAALDLVWVAEGRIDACVLLTNKPWDTAAGVLIARESGAVVTDSNGAPHSLTAAHTIAAAPLISAALLELVQQAADCVEQA
ncbi:inositol monophosphatase family protein [Nocardia sp. NPDC059240]|uniref:inositol monophosphatase family protein n=1 Tax=Nocardia sp. NPDC059240 TaxID=3346786 RepID=UPI0036B4BB31